MLIYYILTKIKEPENEIDHLCIQASKIGDIDKEYFKPIHNERGIATNAAIVYSKSLRRNILVVVEEMIMKGKVIHRLLFSTDINQSAQDVIDIYHTRFSNGIWF